MTADKYRAERKLRGSQEAVAALLDVARETIVRREAGDPRNPISRESWLALLSLPKTKKRAAGTSNDQDQTVSPKL